MGSVRTMRVDIGFGDWRCLLILIYDRFGVLGFVKCLRRDLFDLN